MQYNPVNDNFVVYEQVDTPEPTTFKLPLFDTPTELDWASSINYDTGTPIVKSNLHNVIEDNTEMQTPISTKVETPTETNLSNEYVSGTYASKFNKGDKQLLLDTIDKLNDSSISSIKGFLLDTAAFESTFNHKSTSKASTASGWFGFLDGTKKQFAGVSRQEFNNSPEIQVKAAAKLYYHNLDIAKKLGLIDAAKKKGYSTNDVIHAMWLNPTWAKNFFLYGKEGGKDAFGTNIKKYLDKIHGRK